jgi:hypothetical protein
VTGARLTLHIDSGPEGQVIAGRLRDGCGEEHQFTGWLGLLSLLEQVRLGIADERSAGANVEANAASNE